MALLCWDKMMARFYLSSRAVLDFVRSYYDCIVDYQWASHPSFAVIRHTDTNMVGIFSYDSFRSIPWELVI